MENSLEQTLQDGKLYRQLNSLIVTHLRDNNLNQASTRTCTCIILSLSSPSPSFSVLNRIFGFQLEFVVLNCPASEKSWGELQEST